jgi:hypothetical protein
MKKAPETPEMGRGLEILPPGVGPFFNNSAEITQNGLWMLRGKAKAATRRMRPMDFPLKLGRMGSFAIPSVP